MNSPSTSRIKLLPEHLIDQIKAGEVIERPAALLKELIENSIDAGAGKIQVEIQDSGLTLLSVEDNGHGMGLADLPYAFCRHATSKLETFADLYQLHSFGFRGEALASIASVARVTCHSATKAGDGGKIQFEDGHQTALVKIEGREQGTSIYVKDLFYNTPARLKFIRSQASEKSALKKILESFLLSHPEITFTIKWDLHDRDIYPAQDFLKRAVKVLGKGKAEVADFLTFEREFEGHTAKGIVAKNSTKGSSGKIQVLTANGRNFQDHGLSKMIANQLAALWPVGESGHYFVALTIPPAKLDVNVHPNKTRLKFLCSSIVSSLLSAGLAESLRSHAPRKTLWQNPVAPSRLEQTVFPSHPVAREVQDEKPQMLLQLPEHFYFFRSHDNPGAANDLYLLNSAKALGHFISTMLTAHYPVPEDNVVPLLISEPIAMPAKERNGIDQLFPRLKKMGLELDRLDQHMLALRSVPEYLKDLPYRPLLSALLPLLEASLLQLNQSDQAFIAGMQKIFKNWHVIDQEAFDFNYFNFITRRFDLPQLKEFGLVKEITPDFLRGHWPLS